MPDGGGPRTTSPTSGKKKEPKPNFLVWIFSGGVAVFHVKGWGPKSSVCSFETQGNQIIWRDIPGFCQDIPGAPEKFEKQKLCSICVPYYWLLTLTEHQIDLTFFRRQHGARTGDFGQNQCGSCIVKVTLQ